MNIIEIIGYIALGIGIIIITVLLMTVPTYFLWNWLMPKIFGLPKITLLQALGISMLSSILFKNLHIKKN